MEYRNETFSGSSHATLACLASLEQIVKSKTQRVNDKMAACRQQYILLKSLNQKLADDFAVRNWKQNYSIVEYDQEFRKDLNILFANNERHTNLDFTSIDITCSVNSDTYNEMSKEEYFKINLEQRENDCMMVGEKLVGNIEYSSKKTPSTMEDHFSSARQILNAQTLKKNLQRDCDSDQGHVATDVGFNFSATKKSLGRQFNFSRKKFISPKRIGPSTNDERKCDEQVKCEMALTLTHPALKNIDPRMVELINNEIIHEFKPVDWSEIAGLHYAKSIIKEAVVYPLLRPDIFTGLRRPPRGILLFGPPGTGKTLIGKCIASQSSSTFFSISSATLTSKWMGEGEKMVRALFAVAAARQPSVIFIDEVDALLSQRSENENEGTRRLKTEFLVRLDGTSTSDDDRVLIVGATNRPQELDEAVRRRFVKRLYVPLPEADARAEILSNLLKTVKNSLNVMQIEEVSNLTEGYSGADIDSLCREASMEPLRSLTVETIVTYPKENLRHISIEDFYIALKKVRPSVSQNDLSQLVEWNKVYGCNY